MSKEFTNILCVVVGLLCAIVLPRAMPLISRRTTAAKPQSASMPMKKWPNMTNQRALRKRYESFGRAIDEVITWNIEDLKRDYTILVQHDKNGAPILKKWEGVVDQFLTDIVRQAGGQSPLAMLMESATNRAIAARRVTTKTALALQQAPANLPFSDNITPAEYEGYCANQLRGGGWTVFQTKLVGDQGVDLIAEKDGMRVALQCKLYTSPVGNKAVQEIAAGKVHHRAMYGVVVTNNRYTDAAKALAASNKIHLLHHNELASLKQILTKNAGQKDLFAA
jgi:Restriction endonuclease